MLDSKCSPLLCAGLPCTAHSGSLPVTRGIRLYTQALHEQALTQDRLIVCYGLSRAFNAPSSDALTLGSPRLNTFHHASAEQSCSAEAGKSNISCRFPGLNQRTRFLNSSGKSTLW
jgi:hypothetical protein